MAIRHLTEHTDTMHLWIFKALCASTATIPLRVRLAAAETSSNYKTILILVQQKAEKKLAGNRQRTCTRIFQRRMSDIIRLISNCHFCCHVRQARCPFHAGIWAIQLAWLRHDVVGASNRIYHKTSGMQHMMQSYATESLISSASVLTVDGCSVVEFKAHLTQQLSIHSYRHVFTYNFHTFPSIFVPTNRCMHAPVAPPVHPSNTNSHSPGRLDGWSHRLWQGFPLWCSWNNSFGWNLYLGVNQHLKTKQLNELIMKRRMVTTMTWYGCFQK